MDDAQDGLIADVSPQAVVSLRTFTAVTGHYLIGHWSELQSVSVPVFRIRGRGPDVYYVGPTDLVEIEGLAEPELQALNFVVPSQWLAPSKTTQVTLGWDRDPFFVRWRALLDLRPPERVEKFRQKRQEFEAKLRNERDPAARAKLIAAVTETAFLANKACMSLEKSQLHDVDQELVHETILMIQEVLAVIEESEVASSLMLTLRSLSTGQTIDHVVRVFAMASAFFLHMKNLHSQRLVGRLRAAFPNLYKPFYRKLLPQVSDGSLTSDNVVRFRSLTIEEIREYALGTLLHDLGKTMDLGYFEGQAAYDAARVKQHVLLGSGLFLRTYGQKHEEARYIIGDHHNALFHPDGYGLTRWDRSRGGRSAKIPQACVADTLEGYQSGEALTFFPVEVCSVVDVFDALTDPFRSYQTVREPPEAAAFMAREFVGQGKMDPVVFDLFIDFLKLSGVKVDQPGFEERLASKKPWS